MIYGYAALGYEGVMVSVEVHMSNAIPGLEIIGLASNEVREARDRVKIAIRNSGFHWPSKRILVNLSPADIKKKGAGFDLPIALAILEHTEQLRYTHEALPIMAFGELQFNGALRPVPMGLATASCALSNGVTHFIVPTNNVEEIFSVKNTFCFSMDKLEVLRQNNIAFQSKAQYTTIGPKSEIVKSNAKEIAQDEVSNSAKASNQLSLMDLSYCYELKRVIQITATGRHSLYLCGAPGTGKTAAAIRIPSLLPELSYEESLEVSKIYACSNVNFNRGNKEHRSMSDILIQERPVRMPHHTASAEGMIGSVQGNAPGEISLAHTGVLILDEAPEFKMQVLQSLREPMDSHQVQISRAGSKWECPSDFQLILTSNLCPCGNLGKSELSGHFCLCSEREIFKYWKRIGGAIWDRIDIKYKTQVLHIEKEESFESRENTMQSMQAAVQNALAIQKERYAGLPYAWNSRCPVSMIETHFYISASAQQLLQQAIRTTGSSERGRAILSRVARTIADLENSEEVQEHHIEEAIVLSSSVNPIHNLEGIIDAQSGAFSTIAELDF